jgi:hypothetical protein
MNYVAAGYGITFLVLTAYTVRVLRRARAISRSLPESKRQDRPWR